MNSRNPFSDTSSAGSRLPLVALALVLVVIAYEWLNSAFTKIVHGGFANGLADELAKNSQGAPDWYKTALTTTIIPHATVFGYTIELGELLVGAILIASAIVLLIGGHRLSVTTLRTVFAAVVLTTVGGAFMNLNFSLLSGGAPVWSLGSDTFSEGVGIDGLLMLMQLAIAGVSASLVYSLRDRRVVRVVTAKDTHEQTARQAA
jgi:hypothetical protein